MARDHGKLYKITDGEAYAGDFTARQPLGISGKSIKQVTSAQVLALFATPITLVAAPGAGRFLALEAVMIHLPFNSAAYAGIAAAEDLAVRYTGAAGLIVAQVEATGFLDAVADATRYATPVAFTAAPTDVTPVLNAPLVLHMTTAEVITGDSPLNVTTLYREFDTTFQA